MEAEVKRLTKLFQVNPRMVKARIESLIERNFLKRDDTNRAKYHYVPWIILLDIYINVLY